MKADSVKDFVLDQLRELRRLQRRAMLGGIGLYADGEFIRILYRGGLYFKTDETSRVACVERGRKGFRPNDPPQLSSRCEVPAAVIGSADELAAWARAAFQTVGSSK